MADDFVIISHRGDSSAAPENTVQAFDLALSQGFHNFETDCQLSSDGIPVLLHDESLGRVNNGSGPAAAASAQQLQQLDAGSWFGPQFAGARIPLLEEVLLRYRGQVHLHLELKSQQQELPAAVAALVHELQWLPAQLQAARLAANPADSSDASQAPAEAPSAAAAASTQTLPATGATGSIGQVPGLTITSFHLQQLQASKQLLPSVPHGWLIQEVTADVIATAKQSGFNMVCPRANALTAEGVQSLKQQGFAVRAWGVKTLELLHHVVACGADGATVNWPKQAAEALRDAVVATAAAAGGSSTCCGS